MEIDVCPRLVLRKVGVPEPIQNDAAILLSTLFAIAMVPLMGRIPHVCLFQAALHIPCPGCGILHSLRALFHLGIAEAVHANPAGLAVGLCFVFQIIARPIALFRPIASHGISQISHFTSLLSLGSLMGVWVLRLF